jgi:hypothetical protein
MDQLNLEKAAEAFKMGIYQLFVKKLQVLTKPKG